MSSTIRNCKADGSRPGRRCCNAPTSLATFSEEPDRLTRRFATPALHEAGEQVREWMQAAGMTDVARRDRQRVGRAQGTGPGTLILGSHLDTVRGAGRYDGMLGVLAQALGLSVVVLASGAALFWWRDPVQRLQDSVPTLPSARRATTAP